MDIARGGVTRPGNRTRLTNCFSQICISMISSRRLDNVDDQQLWDRSFRRLKALYSALPQEAKSGLTELLVRYCQTKEALAAVTAGINASSVCRQCGGQCCLNGKYRINVFDTLGFIKSEVFPSIDFAQKPLCPYGSHDGCSLEPALRPSDCIKFICEELDEQLSSQSIEILAAGEQCLRNCIEQASRLTGEPLRTPLLLWTEKQRLFNIQ